MSHLLRRSGDDHTLQARGAKISIFAICARLGSECCPQPSKVYTPVTRHYRISLRLVLQM